MRDWGWAPEYVKAIHQMLQLENPEDFVIATGKSNSLQDFVAEAFNQVNLKWDDYCIIDEQLKRPADLSVSKANPCKAKKFLVGKQL